MRISDWSSDVGSSDLGERRWRAAQAAGLHEIPAVIRQLDDATGFELALVENIQRADLNPIEEAEGFQRLIAEFGHSQEALGKLVHKSRSHLDRKSGVEGKSVSVRVDHGGRRSITKKQTNK